MKSKTHRILFCAGTHYIRTTLVQPERVYTLFILLPDSSQDDRPAPQAVSVAFGMLVLAIVTGYGFRFRP